MFIAARISPTGELVPDDVVEPKSCDDDSLPFRIQTAIFPAPPEDYPSLRFEFPGAAGALEPHLPTRHSYYFTKTGFTLSTDTSPEFYRQTTGLYAFAAPGKSVLQVFFRAASWETASATSDRLDFSFGLVRSAVPAATPDFTLLEGSFQLRDRTLHIERPPLAQNGAALQSQSPELQFHLIDSLYTLRIRSIYTLLTEDFAIWNGVGECQALQNWDLSLIPATGYRLLEVQMDPLFLDCLLATEEPIRFRVALLR